MATTQATGAIVLAAPSIAHHVFACDGALYQRCDASWAASLTLQLSHGYKPIWFGHECRTDASGRTWERQVNAVHDDFGDLVEVPS